MGIKYVHNGFIDVQKTGKRNAFLLGNLQGVTQIFIVEYSVLLSEEAEKFTLQMITVWMVDGQKSQCSAHKYIFKITLSFFKKQTNKQNQLEQKVFLLLLMMFLFVCFAQNKRQKRMVVKITNREAKLFVQITIVIYYLFVLLLLLLFLLLNSTKALFLLESKTEFQRKQK